MTMHHYRTTAIIRHKSPTNLKKSKNLITPIISLLIIMKKEKISKLFIFPLVLRLDHDQNSIL